MGAVREGEGGKVGVTGLAGDVEGRGGAGGGLGGGWALVKCIVVVKGWGWG